jgi:hypothetical protein
MSKDVRGKMRFGKTTRIIAKEEGRNRIWRDEE